MNISNIQIFTDKCLINGEWVSSSNVINVTNPEDDSVIGTVPSLSESNIIKAIDFADEAFSKWRDKAAKERSNILRKWFDLIISHKEDLSLIMHTEQGKPMTEARAEIDYAASFVEWYAEEAKRVYGDVIPAPRELQNIIVLKQPIGVVAAITPWNFPAAMITRKVAPALAAGCTVIIKPASETPYTALALGKLATMAGLPEGVINIVTGKASMIGKILTDSNKIRKLSFTGSIEVGKLLYRASADTVKKISLELGGNAPFIVFKTADLDKAVEGLIISKYRNSGQTCICPNRVLVESTIYDLFIKKLVARLKQGLEQGPLINKDALNKVIYLIEDAVSKGAKLILGGKPKHGNYFEETVICDVTNNMKMASEEIFGPVSAIYKFDDEREAITLANNTPYGLAGYFYSQDYDQIWKVAKALECGMIGINESRLSNEVAPFGGLKESGIGREGGYYGIEEYLEKKYILC